ncbi:MAG: penicillin-binding transpeptidase domain-containing protein [Planctomycetota bacterium]|nr:penicillin-binding transpeptidase domain-containing protein [Planctomycetota bacterium]
MQRSRILSLALLIFLMVLVLGWRLVQLQALDWRQHALRAASIHRSVRYIPGPRGEIRDVRGLLLASDVPEIRATFLLSELEPVRWVARRLSRVIDSSTAGFPWDADALWSSLQGAREQLRTGFVSGETLGEHAWLKNLDMKSGRKLNSAIAMRPEDFPGIRIEESGETCSVFIDPMRLFAGEIGIRRLERELKLTPGELWKRVEQVYARVQDQSIDVQDREWMFRRQRHLLLEKVPPDLVIEISKHPQDWPGIHLQETHRRVHPEDPFLGQLLGNAGLPTDREVERWKQRQEPVIDQIALRDLRTFEALRPYSHHSSDRVGRSGLEMGLEETLRGRPGAEIRILDHRRRLVGTPLQVAPAQRGQNVTLSIDFEFSQQCGRWLTEAGIEQGATVVLDVQSGQALGWCSLPAQGMEVYRDRDLYSQRIRSEEGWFFDRVSSWPIDPGSTFKTVVALVALQAGVVHADEKITCDGILDRSQPNRNRCSNHPRGLELDLPLALSRSCNVYFYHLGNRLGVERLVAGSRQLGLWQRTGCGAVGEARGIRPDSNPAGSAIGRGFTTTPLQMAQVALSIAHRGDTPGIRLIAETAPEGLKPQIDLKHYETVIDGMVSAVRDRAGTASKPEYGLARFDVAVKTGTAAISGSARKNNAWIIGFAPVVEPRIAFAIAVQGVPGHGGETCAPLLSQMLEWLVDHRDMELLR